MDRTTKHLQRLSHEVLSKNVSLSRYFFDRSVKSIGNKNDRQTIDKITLLSRCSFCYTLLQLENCSMKLRPKPAHTKQVKQLMKRMGQNQLSIGSKKKKLVQDYIHKHNKLVIVCKLCKKSNVLNGQSRLERQKQKEFVEQEREEELQLELPVEPVKTRRDKKRERRKMMRQKKLRGEIDEDINAGLLIPTVDDTNDAERLTHMEKVTPDSTMDNQKIESTATNKTVPSTVPSTVLSLGKICTSKSNEGMLSTRRDHGMVVNFDTKKTKTDAKFGTHSSALTNLIDMAEKTSSKMKSGLTKVSNTNRNRKFAASVTGQKPSGTKGQGVHSTVIGNKSVTDKKNKAKKMSQQLGRLLKQEQKKPTSSGSLTDFLSCL